MTGDQTARLTGTLHLLPVAAPEPPTLSLYWRVLSASVSGLSVASLQLSGESYKPYKGVRTIAQAGKCSIRST